MSIGGLSGPGGLSASAGACNGIVLVHRGPDSGARAGRLLSWYDAGARVAPHEEKCACIDSAGRPLPTCPRCRGTGRWLALDNPDAKFTSARLVVEWPEWDVSALAQFAAAKCLAIVTPDGEWHDRAALGARDWSDQVLYLLGDHAHFAALGYRFLLIA